MGVSRAQGSDTDIPQCSLCPARPADRRSPRPDTAFTSGPFSCGRNRSIYMSHNNLRWSASKKTAYFKTIRQLHWRAPTTPPDLPPGWYGWPATQSRAQIPKVPRSVAARSHGAASKIAVFGQKLLCGAVESGICGSTHRTGTGAIFGSARFSRD